METRTLGPAGPEIPALGLGCFGMSHAYGAADPAEAEATLRRALDLGCNFLDTADSYGGGHNEQFVGKAIRHCRDQVVLATKLGFVWDEHGRTIARNGSPDHVFAACNASLQRLQTDRIDLLYLHRIDPDVPVEDTVGAMAELVRQGKVLRLGLSEASVPNIRRAHAIHRISALQSEYSLWARDPEQAILPLCRQLGILFVAFAPLGRAAFVDKVAGGSIESGDFRRLLPRFSKSRRDRNQRLASQLQTLAAQKACSPAQLSLAWLLARGPHIAAVPGTTKRTHLEDNLGALLLELTPADLELLDATFASPATPEPRYPDDSLFKPD